MGIPLYVDETSGMGDQAILAGIHLQVGRAGDFVGAIGPGRSFGTGYLVPARTEGALAMAAQLNVDSHFVGIGFDALAGVGRSRRYAATGVSFSIGWFR